MGKVLTTALLLLLLYIPGVAAAGEPTLYGIGLDVFESADAVLQCSARQGTCSEDEAETLRFAVQNSLRDAVRLVLTGDRRSLMLTVAQVRSLNERVVEFHERLVRGAMFGRACNAGLALIANACTLWSLYVTYFIPSAGLSTIYLLGAIISVGLGSLLQLACLFWWL